MENTQSTVSLLNEITQNADMGRATITQLLGDVENEQMKQHLHKELATYEDIGKRASAMLAVNGKTPKQQSAVAKLGAKVNITMNTLADKSPRHMSEMLMQGCQMGVTSITEALKDYAGDANDGAVALAQRLQKAENDYEGELKKFL
ncbi:MAG: hypothetical protein RR573_04460 [Oscillospiraceae bacterium]